MTTASNSLSGKVALVTGAASGIGEAIARRFAASGATVIVADVDEAAAKETAASIGELAFGAGADVSSAEAMAALVDDIVREHGRLDIAVNNAGIGGDSAPTGDYPLDAWRKVMSVNLDGVFYSMRAEIPALLQSGGGSIINIGSILSSVGFGQSAAYVAAKHGVAGLTKTAAIDYATQGIRVNAVGPGFIETPLLQDPKNAELVKGIAAMHPVQRLGQPEEIAALVAFLASDEASFITGSYYTADGGYTAQ